MRKARVAAALLIAVLASQASAATTTRKKAETPAKGATAKSPKKGASAKGTAKSTKRRASPAAAPAPAAISGDPREEQAKQSAERERLTEQIRKLKEQIAAGEKSKAGAQGALAKAERELARVNERLDALGARQRSLQNRMADLERQRTSRQSEIADRQGEMRRAAVALYAGTSGPDATTLLLTGGDPNRVLQENTYYESIVRQGGDEVSRLQGRVSDLQHQQKRIDDENTAVAREAEAQRAARESLAADRKTQRDTLAKVSSELAEQRKSAAAMQADERRLSRVVEELQRVIERRAAEEAARREAARKRAEEQAAAQAKRKRAGKSSPKSEPESPPPPDEPPAEPPVTGVDFGGQQGRLRLPARGTVVARYGSPRGSGGASWKGLFIRTEPGAEVRAVAAGRVVFADYLRGFGNLLIVDHGDQYLSIYGNNETLSRKTGDKVAAGDVVSLAGNSSGDDLTGLYFELRFRGKPIDPARWTGGR